MILNDNGLIAFKKRDNHSIVAVRQYEWVDRILIMDESKERLVIDDLKFSEFDQTEWIAITKKEWIDG